MKIADLMEVDKNERDLTWLRNSLQTALELELFTLPPYLIALWSIKETDSPAYDAIRNQISEEEMLHMALVCNLIVSMGRNPDLTSKDAVPTYPDSLPGLVDSTLKIPLQRFSKDALQFFLAIEYPEEGPILIGNDPKQDPESDSCIAQCAQTIGEFYTDILEAFENLEKLNKLPEFKVKQQLEAPSDFNGEEDRVSIIIDSMDAVRKAITIIKRQGEGSSSSPEDTGADDLSHYYRFLELDRERRIEETKPAEEGMERKFVFSDKPEDRLSLPREIYNMATIPDGGYKESQVPDAAVWEKMKGFNKLYSNMLKQLENAWNPPPNQAMTAEEYLSEAIITSMSNLTDIAIEILEIEIPDGSGEFYGPSFIRDFD